MNCSSRRNRILTGVLSVGLLFGVVACGGDDSSSGLSRDDLLAILEAAQVDRDVAESFNNDELEDLVDQLLDGFEELPAPETTAPENPDVTLGEAPVEPAPETSGAPEAEETPDAPDESTPPETEESPDPSISFPIPSVVLTLPNATLPLGNLVGLASTLGIAGVTFTDSGGVRTWEITVTENGFGNRDITSVKVTWIVNGVQTPIRASKKSESITKSVWTATSESGPARLTVTAIDSEGDQAAKSYIFNS